jgi:hypothetical protein
VQKLKKEKNEEKCALFGALLSKKWAPSAGK